MINDVPVQERKNFTLSSKPDNTEDTYSKAPVSQFAQNLLSKMGFQEGQPIGKNSQKSSALLKPIEFLSRGDREGLGVNPMKTYRYAGEKEKQESDKFQDVVILSGKYKKMKGVKLEVIKTQGQSDTYLIELKSNGEKIKIAADQVVEAKFYKEEKSRSRSKSKSQKQLKWITSGIVVKVKNKHYQGGKFYNKNISISDVQDEYTFSALGSHGELIEDLKEKDVKVTLPKKGGRVCIVKGEFKGELGQFVEKKEKKIVLVKLENGRLFEFEKKSVCRLI
ncbi:unnamed protein product (macronuclear) [Paramecium tetraurelia]|uniref:G-patch domain-containing protein n=1 Tax=Paramecium tetraurelia TaxID=5888 RepID=A0EB76_PARTE|nr:uncharacterized protein GSPATT00025277001 [Paramecium tetraurelia]CAK92543.1 unnamed protein product [Paramecium tetraurelia]|eukprot:XP_001459940.1 hypothetical protein (macronuclear) [Paramecium tetraurelia strain d4-2]